MPTGNATKLPDASADGSKEPDKNAVKELNELEGLYKLHVIELGLYPNDSHRPKKHDLATALPDADWGARERLANITGELFTRYEAIKVSLAGLREAGFASADGFDRVSLRRAVTEVFVEKALRLLTQRADSQRRRGTVSFLAAFAILFVGSSLVGYHLYYDPVSLDAAIATQELILRVIQIAGLAGLVFAAAKLLFDLGAACYHEEAKLLERRHALRFGRLFVFLKDDQDLSLDDVAKAFEWNRDATSAFQSLSSKGMDTPFGKALDAMTKAVDSLANAVGRVQGVQPPGDTRKP